jgi:hypothetical protein
LKKIALDMLVMAALLTLLGASTRAQTEVIKSEHSTPASSYSPTFFPHNWIRGYTDFAVAPSHNEPDFGRCMFPQPASSGGSSSTCTAYGRYLFIGYIELQPLGRTFARHFFVYLEPKMAFGRNIPQLKYSASMEPIFFERSVGVGFQLPHNLELRATQHQVDYLGRYSRSLGPADLHTDGPYGLYATFGVRWSFGGYGHQGSPAY